MRTREGKVPLYKRFLRNRRLRRVLRGSGRRREIPTGEGLVSDGDDAMKMEWVGGVVMRLGRGIITSVHLFVLAI